MLGTDATFLTASSAGSRSVLAAAQRTSSPPSRQEVAGALEDVSRMVAQPMEERLANLERYTRCPSVRFNRKPPSKEDTDLQRLMPASLLRSDDVWEYTSCAICLIDFADGEELRRASCAGGHAFHPKCIRAWLERSNATCPVCRGGDSGRRKGGQPGKPAPDALAEYIIRRMRSGKVDLSVSAGNQGKSSRILQKMREPAPPTTEPPIREEVEEGPPPKVVLPQTTHIAALLDEAANANTSTSTLALANTSTSLNGVSSMGGTRGNATNR